MSDDSEVGKPLPRAVINTRNGSVNVTEGGMANLRNQLARLLAEIAELKVLKNQREAASSVVPITSVGLATFAAGLVLGVVASGLRVLLRPYF